MQTKADIRAAVKERLKNLSEKDREIESRALCKTLKQYLGNEPKIIGAYMPISDEPNIRPLLEEMINEDWTIAIPGLRNNECEFRIVNDLNETQKGQTTILEPTNDHALAEREKIFIVLLPGRAFTRNGDRLGRGNGGYDRWIAEQRRINPQTRYIGICFERQIVPELPIEPHDEKIDVLMTYRGPLEIKQ